MHGAVGESRHVFIQHGLNSQLAKDPIHILEFGFGTGLNAFLAFLFSVKHEKEIHYTGIESFPIAECIAKKLDYPSYCAALSYEDVFLRMHAGENFTDGKFQFNLASSSNDLTTAKNFDCIFFDAFAPSIQEEVWQQEIFESLFSVTNEGGCLVTYCAKGEVRRRMEGAGFQVERLPGSAGKREMLRAIRNKS